MISTIMLICAVAASLGMGVMVAHWICVGMFKLFRMHALQVAARKPAVVVRARLDVVGS